MLEILSYTDFSHAPAASDWISYQGVPGALTFVLFLFTLALLIFQLRAGRLVRSSLLLGTLTLCSGATTFYLNYSRVFWEVDVDAYPGIATWLVPPLILGGIGFSLSLTNLFIQGISIAFSTPKP